MINAFLLTRRWWDSPRGLELEYWARSDEAPVRVRIDGEHAVFFVERQIETATGNRKAIDLESMHGRPVDAIYFSSQRQLIEERDRLANSGRAALEADIKPSDRFLMERFITTSVQLDGAPEQCEGFIDFHNPTVRRSDLQPTLSLLSIDIETEDLDGQLFSIALASRDEERVLMLGQGPPHPAIDYHADETTLLRAFFQLVRELDPDLLLGWNVVEFDLDFLAKRCRSLGIAFDIGRDRRPADVLLPRGRNQLSIARVPGRVVLDGIAALRAATWSFESFALQDVARELLGKGKLINAAEDRVDEIKRLFAEDKVALAQYNLEDCRLVLDIFDRADLVGFLAERQRLTGLPMDRQGGSVAAFDYLYLPRLHRRGYVAPSVGVGENAGTSPGGYVLNSLPGLHHNVLVLDFKSLYPSIIRTFKIDPMGLAFPGHDPIEGFEGARFAREAHILPELITSLWQARDEAKRRADAASSQAIKILMNSFYGVLGSPGCRFFNPQLASSITLRGHELITRSRDFIEAQGHQVVYGDTDSLFVLMGENKTEFECQKLGDDLAAALNRFWCDVVLREHAVDSHLEIEFETHYLRFFMPTMRGSEHGSKKRYAGSVQNAAGEFEIVFKGMEAVRTDWTPAARAFQQELFRRIFTDEPFDDYIVQVAADLRAGKLDDQLVYRKRLRRNIEEYTKNVPPHVQAARKQKRPGRVVAYYITINGPEPVELLRSPIDYRHYLERQLAPAADAILQCKGTDFVALCERQMSLF